MRVDVVDTKGNPIASQPVDLNELLTRHSRAIQIGNGVGISVSNAGAQGHREVEEVPPSFRKVSSKGEATFNQSVSAQRRTTGGVGKGTLNPEEWVAAAPQGDKAVDFTKLVTLDLTQSANSRKFRPLPLSLHSIVSFSDGVGANRMLVYGGNTGLNNSSELLEFSLSNATWRRVETLHACVGGVSGHTATIYGKKMIVVGGFARGGQPIPTQVLKNSLELKRYELLCPSRERLSAVPPGMVSIVQELNISTRAWRALPIGHPFYMAGHTTVLYNGLLFCFGGVDDRLEVQGDLVAIDPSCGAVKLMRHTSGGPKKRFLHSATLYNNWMIVYGGLDASNDVLHDVWAFNFVTEEWEEMHVVGMEGGRFGHSAVALGSRLLIIGGQPSLEDGADLCTGVAEISLIPIKDAFRWRAVPLSKKVADFSFGAVAPCGDGVSFLAYGGRGKPQTVAEPESDEEGSGRDSPTASHVAMPTQQCVILRFDDKPKPLTAKEKQERKKAILAEQPAVLPESTQIFLRRQEEFVRGKELAISKSDREFVLQTKEAADSSLTLTQEEVGQTIDSMAELIAQVRSYNMDTMPGQAPDKPERIGHNEDILKTLNQINENLLSMKKKDAPKAVKSKGHRRKAGEKFEDFSAVKPFRRVVIMDLLKEVRKRLAAQIKLNRNLANFIWEEKGEYVDYTVACQDKLVEFVGLLKEITDKYINRRVQAMEESRKRHTDVILSLRREVEEERRARLHQTSTQSMKRTHSGAGRVPDKKITIAVSVAEVDQWANKVDAAASDARSLRDLCADGDGPGKRHLEIREICNALEGALLKFKADLSEAPREGAVVPLAFRGYAELQHKCGHSVADLDKATTFIEAQTKHGEDAPKVSSKLKLATKALHRSFTCLQQAVGGRFLAGSTALPTIIPDPPLEPRRSRPASSKPRVAHIHTHPQHSILASGSTVDTPPAVAVPCLVEPLISPVEASRPASSQPRWFDPFASRIHPENPRPAANQDDYFAPVRFIQTPSIVPPIQTPAADLPVMLSTPKPVKEAEEIVPVVSLEGDNSPARPPPCNPDAPTPAPSMAKISDPEEHAAEKPELEAISAVGTGTQVERRPCSSQGVQVEEQALKTGLSVRYVPAEVGSYERYLEFTAPQPSLKGFTQKENVGTCSRCQCVNVSLSKDRGMFKGRLTPGERAILENRIKNAM